ncbi:MAG TPA: SprT-like domain-containing protein, partial [Vicinamibacterales bacterium]|nr:SprT-like domain-containing protein [Vicinamibacterales bacterium]
LIILNPDIRANPQELQRALCHEMVHVAVWTQDRGHGPVFQRFLRDLADQGAFEGVVASDEEKLALRSTLDGRAAALRSEAEALRTARADVDAAPGSLRTDRTVAYNRRVEEYNASVADFNQLAARYNLMIVYPDGLDRERVDRRPVFADTGGR